MSVTGKWLEFSVSTDGEAAEAVVELFNRFGSGGAVVEMQVDCLEHELNCAPEPTQVLVKAYLPVNGAVEMTRRRLEEGLWHLAQVYPIPQPLVQELDDDWLESWKRQYHRLRIGRRIVVVPDWEEHTPAPGEIMIRLEPGLAFGTGLHPTTRLCLMAIETQLNEGRSRGMSTVLDVGTGSGILAIAAAKLGAVSVLALDADPVAVAVAAENASRNGVSAQVTVHHATLEGGATGGWLPSRFGADLPSLEQLGDGRFDLVVINILAPVIMNLTPALARCLAPQGKLIAGGLIVEQEPDVIQVLAANGLVSVDRTQENDWVCLVAQSAKRG